MNIFLEKFMEKQVITKLKVPAPEKPIPVKVRIPGECPECSQSWGQTNKEEKS